MPLIDETYFVGELKIPNTSEAVIKTPLLSMIAIREKELLIDLLGYSMYKDLIANPDAERWADLKNGKEYTDSSGKEHKWDGLVNAGTKQSLIANYVYYWWMRNQVSQTTGTGEKRAKTENAEDASAADKMIKAWNQMSDMIQAMYRFLASNESVYIEWDYFSYWGVPGNAWYGWYLTSYYPADRYYNPKRCWKYRHITDY